MLLHQKNKSQKRTIEFYYKTKCGVDVGDQMTRMYSVKAGTRRGPVSVFYNILDLASINVFVQCKKKTGDLMFKERIYFQIQSRLPSRTKS